MNECRLLEHISSLGAEGGRGQNSRSEILVNSILEHLRRILNTRQGSVPVDPEFGVPDFTNLAGSFSTGTTDQIVQDMSRMIQRYEPRLRQPQIVFTANRDEVLTLAFSISGTVNVDDREVPVRLTTQVAANGRVSLRRQ
ncbi:type VI secretion system baseplate subunit TssE [Pollutimonas harenae]|uniref:Type VI secretion system baseplate subunit TssE n=1 Tax=Pollutimonas harenae TaxID=657015 RepID=A0A853GQ09_9BURK|nr:type VI secretion system baseplate subunit TssE [Pollutimonas harenae]NYT85128.1 type VI secretion system baseplate subunit TssE [Pollutimonas harenae]TEA72490.1 type VI secretion system baseplate subunit TssE [Pollutimonas harenae]